MNCRAKVFMFLVLLCDSLEFCYQLCAIHQLHEFLTDNEIRTLFQTTRDSVPPYNVVSVVHTLNKKNTENPEVRLQVFDKNIVLQLLPAEGLAFGEHIPIYTVETDESSPQGLRYKKCSEYGLYYAHGEEEDDAAPIIIRHEKHDNYLFDGTIGENFIIRSLPQRIIDDLNKNDSCSFTDSEADTSLHTLSNLHVVFRIDAANHRFRHGPNSTPIDNFATIHNQLFEQIDPDVEAVTVYPEILVILDYDTVNYFRSDIFEIFMYLMAFWNGVDLRYRSLHDPQIRLKLATIVIALDVEATPYLNEYRVDDTVSTEAMRAMGHYLYTEERLDRESYDVAVVITRLEICQWPVPRDDNSRCVAVRGISKFGSVCSWSDTDDIFEGIALVNDKGFNGIATAAHELGHILGVPHDGSTSESYVGGPGAAECSWEDGYLMSSDRFDKNAFEWSNCSIECFKFFLQQSSAKCLYNEPEPATLSRILPGELLSMDEQCVEAGGLDACFHDEDACIFLYCTNKDNPDECFGTAPAAEGSPCEDGKICIGGECVAKRRWWSV